MTLPSPVVAGTHGGSLAAVLDVLLDGAAGDAFSPRARARLSDAARQMPALLTKRLYFELRLVEANERVDFSVQVDRTCRRILTCDDERFAVGSELAAEPLWEHVRALAAAWSTPGSLLDRALASIWLEFDLALHAVGCGAPGVFVDFTRQAFASGTPSERAALAAVAVEPLLRRPMSSAVRRALDHAFAVLPATATIPYAGVLLPRLSNVIRVCVDGLDAGNLVRYLRAVGWPGHVHEVADALRDFVAAEPTDGKVAVNSAGTNPQQRALPQRTLLHLDIGATIEPRLGVEFSLGRRSQLRGIVGETEFMRSLVARGFCTAAALAALQTWPHCHYAQLPNELWRSFVVRRINHIKLVFDAGVPPEAKAYLCAGYEYVPRPPSEVRIAPSRT